MLALTYDRTRGILLWRPSVDTRHRVAFHVDDDALVCQDLGDPERYWNLEGAPWILV